ncbi:MAG: hypothetical protein ACRDYX_19010 [Egibacteraceae bacterium]
MAVRNRRETADLDVPFVCSATVSPTGSSLVPAGGQPGQHTRDDAVGQQIGRCEGVVGLEGDLTLVLSDAAHAGPADRQAASAQGDGAVVDAMPLRGSRRVVAAFGAGQTGDLGVHQLGANLQADRGRGHEQTLT